MMIWTECFGRALTITSGGPPVRFLIAATRIALGKAPNAATMRGVIRRERRRRRDVGLINLTKKASD
jgi:hypothetical protein